MMASVNLRRAALSCTARFNSAASHGRNSVRKAPTLAAPPSHSALPFAHRRNTSNVLLPRGLVTSKAVETPVGETSATVAPLTLQDLPTSAESDEMLRVRHSCAHIMAMAVQKLFKGAQCTIGPWIDHGFYYDFAMDEPLTKKSLPRIRKEMQKIIKKKLPFVREEVSVEEARKRIEAIGETYKLEILDSIVEKDPSAPITIYHIGEPGEKGSWWDLCAGPHVENTGDIDPNAISLRRGRGLLAGR